VEELRYYREKLFIPTVGDEPIAEGN